MLFARFGDLEPGLRWTQYIPKASGKVLVIFLWNKLAIKHHQFVNISTDNATGIISNYSVILVIMHGINNFLSIDHRSYNQTRSSDHLADYYQEYMEYYVQGHS